MKEQLKTIYTLLHKAFGPQHWWPGDSPFEIMLGAILTQNTNWGNVEKAIANLKDKKLLSPQALFALHQETLANLIRPAGFFRVKTKRLRNFLEFFLGTYAGQAKKMGTQSLELLRSQILQISGIGPETADSILLYALNKPIFVVDAYTKRILCRHNLLSEESTYHDTQELFTNNLPVKTSYFNEYHALLVKCGKKFCRPQNPKCQLCPLNGLNW